MNFLTGINATSSALSAEQTRMDIVAQNIANAYTTKDVNGGPYKRRMVTFEATLGGLNNKAERGVRVGKISADQKPGEVLYQPGHPHAGPDGLATLHHFAPKVSPFAPGHNTEATTHRISRSRGHFRPWCKGF